jgi:hypothetical protein
MLLGRIMAPITRIYLRAAAEPKPAIALAVVLTAAAAWQFLPGHDAQLLLCFLARQAPVRTADAST